MRQSQLRSVRSYKRPGYRAGLPATTAPNRLQRKFTGALPDQIWVTVITYIRTHEGGLNLTAVIGLYSPMVLGGGRLGQVSESRDDGSFRPRKLVWP